MANIAIDIDDTLYSFISEAREVLWKMIKNPKFEKYRAQIKNAAYASWDQWRTPYDLCGFDDEGRSLWIECVNACHDDSAILRQDPFPGAADVCWRIDEAGHNIKYISNRNTQTYQATFSWIIRKDFPISKNRHQIIITEGNKNPFIKDCQYQIDDRSKNVIEFIYDYDWQTEVKRSEGTVGNRSAFVLASAHNRGLTDIPNLYVASSWTGLAHYMEEKGII